MKLKRKREKRMWESEYKDKVILALRQKYKEITAEHQEIEEDVQIGSSRIPVYKEDLFHGKCSVLLPESMRDLSYLESVVKYRNRNRPEIIKTDLEGDASFTFSLLSLDNTEWYKKEGLVRLGEIRRDMKKIWKQNVFYDMGEIQAGMISIAWMDFRTFCLEGSLYNLLFLFDLEKETVLGNFHCGFEQYDKWKMAVLRMLATIQKG